MFSKKTSTRPVPSPASGAAPYLNARREWDERYGDAIAQAKTWRTTAAAALAVAAVSVLGVVWLGAQSKIQPFVVAIDELGSPLAVAQPAAMRLDAATQRLSIAHLANWIWNVRTVLADHAAQRVLLDRAYASSSAATAKYLNEHFASPDHNPFGNSGLVTRVTVNTVLPTGGETYEVSWTEEIVKPGQTPTTKRYKATVSVGADPTLAAKPAVAIHNPLGIFIRSLSWAEVAN